MTIKAGLDQVRDCFEGGVPPILATCGADGVPNITLVSQIEYVDRSHVALSFQFFNKTRENILANPSATVMVTHAQTAEAWRLRLHYLRTESAGPLFERMRAKLAGIASQTGMSDVFRLLGSDLYRVASIERVPGRSLPPAPAGPPPLVALRNGVERLAACTDLERLFDETLSVLQREFDIGHSLLLISDAPGARLYAVASRGFVDSGIGTEIALGDGVIGVSARERTPIRITHMSSEYAYVRAARDSGRQPGHDTSTEIPFPGLPDAQSQLAVPLLDRGQCLGVLYVESSRPSRFSYVEEDLLCVLAAQLSARIALLRLQEDDALATGSAPSPTPEGPPLQLRRFAENDSVFVGDEYLIKGVAGALLWKLLRDHASGRRDFTTRELRLDPNLRLPEVVDNLDTRLILLTRRLAERCPWIALDKTGRGRFRLRVERPLQLVEVSR